MAALVLSEIRSTEVAYVSHLQTCMDVFVTPMMDSEKSEKFDWKITHEDCRRVFSNLPHIAQINSTFLNELEECLRKEFLAEQMMAVAILFQRFSPNFKMYTMYTANFHGGRRYLQELLKKNEDLEEFVLDSCKKLECKGNDLNSYLIMPVQRIPRYVLLLKELTKHATLEIKEQLATAILKLEESASHINESIRNSEMTETLIQIQKELGDSVVILSPGRVFVKRGKLFKLSSKWSENDRSGKNVDVFIFSDMLLYSVHAFIGDDKVVQIPFDEFFSFQELKSDSGKLPVVTIKSSKKNVSFQFSSSDEASAWITEINTCVYQKHAKKLSMMAQVSQHRDNVFPKSPNVSSISPVTPTVISVVSSVPLENTAPELIDNGSNSSKDQSDTSSNLVSSEPKSSIPISQSKVRIAIIGSGIAGLSASYTLSRIENFDVTIFESESSLGMGAHATDVPILNDNGKEEIYRVDVPLRVFSEKYYPHLTQVYKENLISSTLENYSGSFSFLGAQLPFFSYQNFLFGKYSLPYISFSHLFSKKFWIILYEYLFFHYKAPSHLLGQLENLTIYDYLKREKYSNYFIDEFFIPTICAICTCSFEAARSYPADIIIEYLVKRFLGGVRRACGGTKEITEKLAAKSTVNLNCKVSGVKEISTEGRKTASVLCNNKVQVFDHVILATPAHVSLAMLENKSADQLRILSSISHQKSPLIVHTDVRLMPPSKDQWRSVNFILPQIESTSETVNEPYPMTSIWLNKVGLIPESAKNVFQTWGPLNCLPVDPSMVLSSSFFERPLVTLKSQADIKDLDSIQGESIWFCGSYCGPGIPLLENAVTSSMNVSRRILDLYGHESNHCKLQADENKNSNGVSVIKGLLFCALTFVPVIYTWFKFKP